MPRSKLAKLLIIGLSASAVSGCSSAPDMPTDEQWYDDIKPIASEKGHGGIYDSRRHGLLLGVGNKYNVGDLIVIEVEEQTNASDTSSNNVKKETDYSHGLNMSVDGEPTIDTDLGIKSDTEFKGSGSSQKSHSLTGDITVVVKKVLPNGNLIVEGSKKIELSNGSEMVGIRGVIREADISTVSNRIESSKVANAYIYYKGEGDGEAATKRGLLTKVLQSKWWIF